MQILNKLEDLATRDATVEKLKANVKVLEDEHGETFSVIPFNDAVVSTDMVLGNFRHEHRLKLHDTTHLSIRKDDIIIIDYMKTGMMHLDHWAINLF